MNLEARLKEATQDPILSELKGSEGLFAITPRELIYVGPESVQRAPLAEVRRVASAKGGRLLIAGKEATFIEASVAGFDVGELKLFFESVKGYVAKARRGELKPPEQKPAAEPSPPSEPEPAPPPPEPEEATLEAIPTEESPPVVPEEEEAPEAGETRPPAPAAREEAPKAKSALRLPLKLLALLTWGYTGAALYLKPDLDPLWMAGLALGGLGLGLVEWRAADL